MQSRQSQGRLAIRTLSKFALVGAGYAGALAIAWGATAFYIAATPHIDRVGESGMTAFGDSFFFLGVFALAATVPSGAGLYFLRPVGAFWDGLSFAALAVAVTAVAAAALYVAGRSAATGTWLGDWASGSVLRLLAAPMLAVAFGVATVFAPSFNARIAIGVATAMEALSFATFAAALFLPNLTN